MNKDQKLSEVLDLVRSGHIPAVVDRAVFYSGARNQRAAVDFCRKNDEYKTVLDLSLHQQVQTIPLFGDNSPFSREEAVDISALLSARFAEAAQGNVLLFYNKVSDRSTFFTVELPILLENEKVTTINGVPKEAWSHLVQPAILPRTKVIEARELAFNMERMSCP